MGWLLGKVFGLVFAWIAWTAGVTILTLALRTDLGDRLALIVALLVETTIVTGLAWLMWRSAGGEHSYVLTLASTALMTAICTGFLSVFGSLIRDLIVNSDTRWFMLTFVGVMVGFGVVAAVAVFLFNLVTSGIGRGWQVLREVPAVQRLLAWGWRTFWNGYGFVGFCVVAFLVWIVATDTSVRLTLDRDTVLEFFSAVIRLAGIMVAAIGSGFVFLMALTAAFVVPGAIWWLIAPYTRAGPRDFDEAYSEAMGISVAIAFFGWMAVAFGWLVIDLALQAMRAGWQTLVR